MKTEIVVNREVMELECEKFTLLCHQGGIKLDVPSHFEINPEGTLKLMRDMSQETWGNVRRGCLFKPLFDIIFQDHPIELPEQTVEFIHMDLGVLHAAGLVILAIEYAFFRGKKIFIRLPETYLHPAQTRHIPDMLLELQALCEGRPNVVTGKEKK